MIFFFFAEQHLHSRGSHCREAGLRESVLVKQAADCLHCNHSGCFHLIGGNLLHSKLTPDWSQGWSSGWGLELC